MNTSSPSSTGWQRGFWNLMGTQAQNAFSDNALKNLVILLVLARPMSEEARNTQVALAGALFAAPFILFSMLGGWLADRFSKQRVMQTVKLAEMGIMLFAAVGLGLHNPPIQFAAIFLMGCHSAIFGPSKYGILPEVLPLEKLSWGNGLLELLTFLGIILGTIAGGYLADAMWRWHSVPLMSALPGLMLAALAFVGWRMSHHITHVPATNPHAGLRINPVTDLWRQLKVMKPDRDLWRANWGNTGFYFIAALVQMNLALYARDVLHLDDAHNSLLGGALAIGIGIGSVVAGYVSRGHIEYRLVPVGAIGLALSTLPMGIPGISISAFCTCLVALGFTGGLFIVPVAAVLQHRPAAGSKGAVQGAANLLSFIGILAASGVVYLNSQGFFSLGQVFWICGALALATGVYVLLSRGWVAPKE
ncbi:MAG: hypothetical protein JWO94_1409 [Verrucomicrobiaceae bacterium]|nr:hypothetical protein [Verrucomicrobiaceae bacterium]